MSKTDLFKDKKPRDIIEALESNAYTTEKQTVRIPFMQGEIEQFKNRLAEASASNFEIEFEKKKVTSKFDEQLKPLRKEISECSKALSDKTYESEETLFGLANYEDGTMDFYNDKGEFINSRPLRASEGQASIHSLKKAN